MVRHTVLFRFKPSAAPAERTDVLQGLSELPGRFPAMRRFGLGENISKRDQSFTHVMTAEFDTREQLEAYLDSREHEVFVATRFRPSIEARAIASYETQEGAGP
jgi:2,3-dihydroxy-p-cumate/2,3-dihydroxybenzoate 3,4-dioxygenase